MSNHATIIADSISQTGKRITTFVLPRFPRCLLAELNTHRQLSRNAESSRAIPVSRRIQKILEDPYIPAFTRNQRGMVGETLSENEIAYATAIWKQAMQEMIGHARWLVNNNIHKEMANRLLEPFARVPVIVTATEWENFLILRTAENTAPDFRAVALEMQKLLGLCKPQRCADDDWHKPFWTEDLREYQLEEQLKICSARCARISYSNHNGNYDAQKDLELAERLITDGHWSPFEHIARPVYDDQPTANLRGWQSFRTYLGF